MFHSYVIVPRSTERGGCRPAQPCRRLSQPQRHLGWHETNARRGTQRRSSEESSGHLYNNSMERLNARKVKSPIQHPRISPLTTAQSRECQRVGLQPCGWPARPPGTVVCIKKAKRKRTSRTSNRQSKSRHRGVTGEIGGLGRAACTEFRLLTGFGGQSYAYRRWLVERKKE